MNNDKKQSSIDKKKDEIQEAATNYRSENSSVLNNAEEMHPILKQLILKSKAESKAGMGIPHEEVMQRLKLKYPFLK